MRSVTRLMRLLRSMSGCRRQTFHLNVYTHLKLEDAEKEIKRLEQEQQMCLLELSLNLKNRLKVY